MYVKYREASSFCQSIVQSFKDSSEKIWLNFGVNIYNLVHHHFLRLSETISIIV
jgi:hypothetical protein